jgi:tetratricopeptide (TPR) repeat protein
MAFTTSRLRAQFEQIQQLRQAGQMAVADMLVSQLLAAPATSADDLYCQGMLLLQAGRHGDALKRFDAAQLRGPAPPELFVDRAIALAQLDRLEDAAAACAAALERQRDFPPALLVLADILREMGRGDEALEQYYRLLKKQRDFVPALRNRADLLMAMRRWDEALSDFDRLLRLEPNDPGLHNARGQMLGEVPRFDDALRSLDKALALAPRHGGAWHNRGVVLWNLERFEDAIAAYDQALALNPNAVTLSNRANTLQEMLRLDEAMAAHDQVVAMAPDFPSGHWNRAQGRMLRGEWAEGLREFEWRKRRPEGVADYLAVPQPEWLGQDGLAGKTLLIRAEQGLGDTIHFIRYAALAQERGAHVILAVQNPLVRLLTESLTPAAHQVIGKDEPLPAFDFHVPTMSLPFAFGTVVENAPARVPYLKADPVRAARWRERLGENGFRIGICWRGGRAGNDRGRNWPLRLLAGIAALPGVRLISLQKGEGVDQLEDLPPGMTVETLGDDFDNGPDAFLDTLAVMENLDLVISSDTSIAHLAGALARPVWLATRFVPEWRWLLERQDSVWYPTMRLFRQPAVGDWSSVLVGMEAELKKKL